MKSNSHRPDLRTEIAVTRRDFLMRAGGGFGGLALAGVLGTGSAGATEERFPFSTVKLRGWPSPIPRSEESSSSWDRTRAAPACL